jgi:hypothetical protein
MGYTNNTEIDGIISCRKCQRAIIKYGHISCGSGASAVLDNFKKNGYNAAKDCPDFLKVVIGEYKKVTLDRALKFMLAGQAEFKIVSGKTGKELYYKLIKRRAAGKYDENGNEFVYWVTGGEKSDELKYLGTIYFDKNSDKFSFARGINGNENSNSTIVKAIIYVLNKVYQGKYDTDVELYHNGTCGRCNRQLTDIQSILTGIDYDCVRKVSIPYNKIKHSDSTD